MHDMVLLMDKSMEMILGSWGRWVIEGEKEVKGPCINACL